MNCQVSNKTLVFNWRLVPTDTYSAVDECEKAIFLEYFGSEGKNNLSFKYIFVKKWTKSMKIGRRNSKYSNKSNVILVLLGEEY
jgi:hypothetical protein